jgi:chaperonin cofactor prefoldin
MAPKADRKALAERMSKLEMALDAAAERLAESKCSASAVREQTLVLEQLRSRVDQLHLRIDALSGRIDSHEARAEARLMTVDAELRELPAMIERGMRAALREVDDD